MYQSVVFVIGLQVANFFLVKTEAIWTLDLPQAQEILQICEAIVIARSDEKQEE